ncbi:hypothetical protein QVD17_10599 [Tagetes erecta]|uniref:Uncharacterized protein n=1 Tax=Tagetes erecta TaxID=13708 RepID=A0AAD8P636_TARER|nr:hypothetical protein QVD17_10599 [Tagetes erecta]
MTDALRGVRIEIETPTLTSIENNGVPYFHIPDVSQHLYKANRHPHHSSLSKTNNNKQQISTIIVSVNSFIQFLHAIQPSIQGF